MIIHVRHSELSKAKVHMLAGVLEVTPLDGTVSGGSDTGPRC